MGHTLSSRARCAPYQKRAYVKLYYAAHKKKQYEENVQRQHNTQLQLPKQLVHVFNCGRFFSVIDRCRNYPFV